MNNDSERASGAFRRASGSEPAPIAVSGTDWVRQSGPRAAGAFVPATKAVTPPVSVDGASWVAPRLAAITEELGVLLAALDSAAAALAVERLVNELNERHQLNLALTRKTA